MIHNLINAWAHTDLTDPTVSLCGWEISQMLLRVGWLARIPLCFWTHTDLTDASACGLARADSTLLLGSHRSHRSHGILCGWKISQMVLCVGGSRGFHFAFGLTQISQIPRYCFVGGKSHRCFCVCGLVWAPMGAHCSRSHGFIFRTLRTNRTFLKIIREICGICVRPPWDWDLCEASVDSVWAGDKITKNCVIWGVF